MILVIAVLVFQLVAKVFRVIVFLEAEFLEHLNLDVDLGAVFEGVGFPFDEGVIVLAVGTNIKLSA